MEGKNQRALHKCSELALLWLLRREVSNDAKLRMIAEETSKKLEAMHVASFIADNDRNCGESGICHRVSPGTFPPF